ncbi:hypothetical protein CHS0354_011123, partial [Potamilus streckersoni]
ALTPTAHYHLVEQIGIANPAKIRLETIPTTASKEKQTIISVVQYPGNTVTKENKYDETDEEIEVVHKDIDEEEECDSDGQRLRQLI